MWTRRRRPLRSALRRGDRRPCLTPSGLTHVARLSPSVFLCTSCRNGQEAASSRRCWRVRPDHPAGAVSSLHPVHDLNVCIDLTSISTHDLYAAAVWRRVRHESLCSWAWSQTRSLCESRPRVELVPGCFSSPSSSSLLNHSCAGFSSDFSLVLFGLCRNSTSYLEHLSRF